MIKNCAILVVFCVIAATILGRATEKVSLATAKDAGAASSTKKSAQNTAPGVVHVSADKFGHFTVNTLVDGRHLEMLVDTGASVIALTSGDAERLGIRPRAGDWIARVKTANGIARAAPVRLAKVEIAGLTIRDVDALVMPQGAMDKNLLGMSFLSRLRRYEFNRSRLILEQ